MERVFMERHVDIILNELFGPKRPSLWVTRERPKIDRIACPWLIRRFIDPRAEFLYVPTAKVFEVAANKKAVAFDIPGAQFSHDGAECSFDAFLKRFRLSDPGLMKLAPIVRGADTDDHGLAPESAGLHAVAIGMAQLYADDRDLLRQGLLLYDALYAWAADPKAERHNWKEKQP
jgi:hypothetical protein